MNTVDRFPGSGRANVREGPPRSEDVSEALEDLTGRDRLLRNVSASWAAYLAYMAGGFLLPRMIDSRIGQEGLGVWDFGWSLVGYFMLVQGGVGSAINRYVSFYRARGDKEGVNRAVSSVACVLLLMGSVVLCLSVGAALGLPSWLGRRLGSYTNDAQWLVLFLGLSLAVQMSFSGFAGVLTGSHRWDLHNAVQAGTYLLSVSAMVVILVLGGGLPGLALANLCGELLGSGLRCSLAFRVCPQLRIGWRSSSWREARSMLGFGGKSLLPGVADILANQTSTVLIFAYLGPASVALYSRPRALVRYLTTFFAKYSFVLTPTSTSLWAMDKKQELRELAKNTNMWAAYVSIPAVLFLVLLGDAILNLWMGPAYSKGHTVLAVLGLGCLLPIAQTSLRGILVGMNAHGRPGLARLMASVVSVSLLFPVLGSLEWGLTGVAAAIAIPLLISEGIYVTALACRRLDMRFFSYLISVWWRPIVCALPLAAVLVVTRMVLSDRLVGLAVGTFAGAAVLLAVYWFFVFPLHYRDKVMSFLRRRPSARV